MKLSDGLASVVEQQARAIADLQQRLDEKDAREGHKGLSWLRAFGVSPNLRLLGLCVLVASAGACCLGAKGTGTATFDNVQIDGTCTGCSSGPDIYYLTQVICRRHACTRATARAHTAYTCPCPPTRSMRFSRVHAPLV